MITFIATLLGYKYEEGRKSVSSTVLKGNFNVTNLSVSTPLFQENERNKNPL